MNIVQRLTALREVMEKRGISAYIIPSSDPHQSEYVADHWKGREWISGFTGSAGTVVVALEEAGLWTDTRYFLQGEEELKDTGIRLMKQGEPDTPSITDWLIGLLESGATVACDARNFSLAHVRGLAVRLSEAQLHLETEQDLLAEIWEDRPPLPKGRIFELELKYAGQSRLEKIAAVRKGMAEVDGHLITTLDDIAWLLNIRGHDVECNPVAIAFLLVEQERVCLFVERGKLEEALRLTLQKDGVHVLDYTDAKPFLMSLNDGYHILLDPKTLNADLFDALPDRCQVYEGASIPIALKAVKNPIEIGHIRKVMAKDAVALVRLYRWLEAELDAGATVTEFEVASQLAAFRAMGEGYYGESFPAIVGYKGNGAIVHYRPLPGRSAQIKKEGILLLDSGGQYLDGTTDITRTTALGTPTDEQKRHFTWVLKGHISLAMQHFPTGTKGIQLDALTRQHLWKQNLNFGHGTGHGVGFFLNVHEGPQGIGPQPQDRYMEPFRAGMFSSNEPGFYLTGEYGIRIENLVLTVPAGNQGFGEFLKFETMTLFPIDLVLLDKTLLTQEEREWLNGYHQMVWDRVSPLLEYEAERKWLERKCRLV